MGSALVKLTDDYGRGLRIRLRGAASAKLAVIIAALVIAGCAAGTGAVRNGGGLDIDRDNVFELRDKLLDQRARMSARLDGENVGAEQKEMISAAIEYIDDVLLPDLTRLLTEDELLKGEIDADDELNRLRDIISRYTAALAESARLFEQVVILRTEPEPAAEDDKADPLGDYLLGLKRLVETIENYSSESSYRETVEAWELLIEKLPPEMAPDSTKEAALRAYLSLGRTERAKSVYRLLSQAGGASAETNYLMGESALVAGERDQAIEYFGRSRQIAEANSELAKKADKRIDEIRIASSGGRSSYEGRLASVRLSLKINSGFGESRKTLSDIISSGPDHPGYAQAKELAAEVEKQEKGYVERLIKQLKSSGSPELAESARRSMLSYLADEPHSQYAGKIRGLIDEFGGDSGDAARLLGAAEKDIIAGRYTEAIEKLRKAVAIDPDIAGARKKLITTIDEYVSRRRKEAADIFLAAINSTKPETKLAGFKKSYRRISELLNDYPESGLRSKLRENLKAVEGEILKLEPGFGG